MHTLHMYCVEMKGRGITGVGAGAGVGVCVGVSQVACNADVRIITCEVVLNVPTAVVRLCFVVVCMCVCGWSYYMHCGLHRACCQDLAVAHSLRARARRAMTFAVREAEALDERAAKEAVHNARLLAAKTAAQTRDREAASKAAA